MVNKVILRRGAISILGVLVIGIAIILGFFGVPLDQTKVAIQSNSELAMIEKNYTMLFNQTYKNDDTFTQLLPKVFNNQGNRYFIRYPANWQFNALNKSTLVLAGKEGTPAYYSNINIQTLRAQKIGGVYSTVPEVILNLKKQIEGTYSNVRYVEQGPITLNQLNGSQIRGEYVVFTYSNSGLAFKQWQVVILRNDGLVFYVFAYNSPLVQYQTNLAIAQAVLKSWDIY